MDRFRVIKHRREKRAAAAAGGADSAGENDPIPAAEDAAHGQEKSEATFVEKLGQKIDDAVTDMFKKPKKEGESDEKSKAKTTTFEDPHSETDVLESVDEEEGGGTGTAPKPRRRKRDIIKDAFKGRRHHKDKDKAPTGSAILGSILAEGEGLYDPVPPDETIEKMDIFLSKKIRGVTIQQFYDTIWKEPTLFHEWLEESGKMDVQVGQWKYAPGCEPEEYTAKDKKEGEAEQRPSLLTTLASSLSMTQATETAAKGKNGTNGGGNDNDNFTPTFEGEWCKEEYTQCREVTFAFQRTTHLYMGPPIAHVKHTQRLRNEDDERCVMHIQVNVGDIPFGNTFNVQIRWVATRLPDGSLQVQAGLFVMFVQAVMVANKIKSGTIEETIPDQQSLFEKMAVTFAEAEGVDMVQEDVYDEEAAHMAPGHALATLPPCFFAMAWFQHLFPPPQQSLVLANQAMAAHVKLYDIMHDCRVRALALEEAIEGEDVTLVQKLESELTDIHSSMDEMLKLLKPPKAILERQKSTMRELTIRRTTVARTRKFANK